MYRNRRRRNQVPLRKYLYYGFLGTMSVWFLASIIAGQSPTTLVKYYWAKITNQDLTPYRSANELSTLLLSKETEVEALHARIDSMESSQYNIATVSVDSPTLNLRSANTLNSEILFKIPNGAAVEILYYDTENLILKGKTGQWCKVKYADKEGWVWGNFLIPRG